MYIMSWFERQRSGSWKKTEEQEGTVHAMKNYV